MIRKAIIEVVVLFDDCEVEPAFFEEATLADLERLMDEEAIGLWHLQSLTAVEATDIKQELHELGNDGSFFDPPADEALLADEPEDSSEYID